jgi:hypothetical protein
MSEKIQTYINTVQDGHTQRALQAIFEAVDTELDALRTLANELRTDHATFKTVVDELTAWAEALATKLNADAGVTDVDYDAVITAAAPATLAAAAAVESLTS